MSEDVEVCVVGAGPAGAALATRLAQLGHDVAIVEQHRFPRPHVGESLSPGIWPLLDVLGVRDSVTQAGFTQTSIARVRWRDDNEERTHVPDGLTVDRGGFDAILLQRAGEAGARSLAPARARRPIRDDDGWELPLA
ncbi:MAG: tryptophan 7-halogenase, partial [Actinomycetota bacterium]|nr:tryptophan 7-halogenase [Actinomycetota bacterium]